MKNFLMMVMVFVATSAFAAEHQGKIINLPQDEEGMKVVIEKKPNEFVMPYLPNNHPNFLALSKSLKDAQAAGNKVKVTTKDDIEANITKVEVLGK